MLPLPSPTRKMYSRSHQVIWTPANAAPQGSLGGIREKVELSLKERLKQNVKLLKDQHKYGRFVDRLLLQHAQEQNLPVINDSLTKKKHYKSCRIIKTEQPDSYSPTARYVREQKGKRLGEETDRKRSQKRGLAQWKDVDSGIQTERFSRESVKRASKEKQKETLELPLIFKYKGSSTEEREKTEQDDMESSRVLRLKELKQSIILKYIRPQ